MSAPIVSYAQNFEDVMLWRALGHVKKGLYIDIGAQDPVLDSVSLAFHLAGWRGIHVEPTRHYFELLEVQRPGDFVVQAAVGKRQAESKLYEIANSGISTLDADIARKHSERGFEVIEKTTRVIPLSAVLALAKGCEVHWMKVDVEGFERQVLASWGTCSIRPWVLVVESTLPMSQTPTHQDWERLVLSRGYAFAYFDGLNRFYVSERHPDLMAAFDAPPNVFDGFRLNGTGSSSFHQLALAVPKPGLIVASSDGQMRFDLEQDASVAEREAAAEQLAQAQRRLVEIEQARQECSLHGQQMARELQELRLSHVEQLKELNEQSQSRLAALRNQADHNESSWIAKQDGLTRDLLLQKQDRIEREREFAVQLKASHDSAAKEREYLIQMQRDQLAALERGHAAREEQLLSGLRSTQEDLGARGKQLDLAVRDLLLHKQASIEREQEFSAQLHSLQGQTTAERDFLAQLQREQLTGLIGAHAQREVELQQQLAAAQMALSDSAQHRISRELTVAAQLQAMHERAQAELESAAVGQRDHFSALLQSGAAREAGLQRQVELAQIALDRQTEKLTKQAQVFGEEAIALRQEHAASHAEWQRRLDAAQVALNQNHQAYVTRDQTGAAQLQVMLEHATTALREQLTRETASASVLREAHIDVLAELQALRTTMSWRFTAPWRAMAAWLRPTNARPAGQTESRSLRMAAARSSSASSPVVPPITSQSGVADVQDTFEAITEPQTQIQEPTTLAVGSAVDDRPANHQQVQRGKENLMSPSKSVADLMELEDADLISCMYSTLLQRSADQAGFASYLTELRRGKSKAELIVAMARSPEGRKLKVSLPGLQELHQRSLSRPAIWLSRIFAKPMAIMLRPAESQLRRLENRLYLLDKSGAAQAQRLDSAMAGLSQLVQAQDRSLEIAAILSSHRVFEEGIGGVLERVESKLRDLDARMVASQQDLSFSLERVDAKNSELRAQMTDLSEQLRASAMTWEPPMPPVAAEFGDLDAIALRTHDSGTRLMQKMSAWKA